MAEAKMSAESQKMLEKCEKSVKSDPTLPQDQKTKSFPRGDTRDPKGQDQKKIFPRRDTRDPLSTP